MISLSPAFLLLFVICGTQVEGTSFICMKTWVYLFATVLKQCCQGCICKYFERRLPNFGFLENAIRFPGLFSALVLYQWFPSSKYTPEHCIRCVTCLEALTLNSIILIFPVILSEDEDRGFCQLIQCVQCEQQTRHSGA